LVPGDKKMLCIRRTGDRPQINDRKQLSHAQAGLKVQFQVAHRGRLIRSADCFDFPIQCVIPFTKFSRSRLRYNRLPVDTVPLKVAGTPFFYSPILQ
jgi:hypothetical protein